MSARFLAVVLCAIALSGCTVFSRKPPLPRHAAIEHSDAPSARTDYAALVAEVEVAYFPAERAASGARSEPSALLLEALRQNGTPFAIAWDILDASQQTVLDELPGKSGAAREEVIAQLEFSGTGRAREHLRAVLRDENLAGLQHVGLRCPPALMAKLETRERLNAEDENLLPRGFTLPSAGFEGYAERVAAGRGEPARSYRAQVASQQYAAERIIEYFRAAGMQNKLLVFLRADDMEAGQGVPRYVAQKIKVRQLVLDSSGGGPIPAKLLTQAESGVPAR
ncbi:MAG: hypothetical protein ABIR71_05520 [Chthoniobacterales bacterium]